MPGSYSSPALILVVEDVVVVDSVVTGVAAVDVVVVGDVADAELGVPAIERD